MSGMCQTLCSWWVTGSQTELELSDTSFQNWVNVVLNIFLFKDKKKKKKKCISQAVEVSLTAIPGA